MRSKRGSESSPNCKAPSASCSPTWQTYCKCCSPNILTSFAVVESELKNGLRLNDWLRHWNFIPNFYGPCFKFKQVMLTNDDLILNLAFWLILTIQIIQKLTIEFLHFFYSQLNQPKLFEELDYLKQIYINNFLKEYSERFIKRNANFLKRESFAVAEHGKNNNLKRSPSSLGQDSTLTPVSLESRPQNRQQQLLNPAVLDKTTNNKLMRLKTV